MGDNENIVKTITDDLFKNVNDNTPFQLTTPSSASSPAPAPAPQLQPPNISSMGTTTMSWFSSLSIMNWIFLVILIILFLAFFGYNIFSYISSSSNYLASNTNNLSNALAPLFIYLEKIGESVGGSLGNVLKTIAQTFLVGVDTTVNVTEGTIEGAIAGGIKGYEIADTNADNINIPELQHTISTKIENKINNDDHHSDDGDHHSDDGDHHSDNGDQHMINNNTQTSKYQPDDSFSSVQSTSKGGFCYYGSDNGIRYCAQVNSLDDCESGQLFNTKQNCINPTNNA